MKSVTKTKLSENELRRIIEHNFAGEKVESIEELKGGLFNTAYIVRGDGALSSGVVIKVGPLPTAYTLTYEKDIMKTEVWVNGMLAGAGVPVTSILAKDFSRSIVSCDYFVMEYMSGTTWHKTDKKELKANKPALMRRFGECNALVHSVRGGWFGYIKDDKRFQFAGWYDAFSAMVGDILEDGKKLGCKLPYEDVTAVVKSNKRCLDDVKEPRLVDFDTWAGNIFLGHKDGVLDIAAIIDLERSFYGDPYADFIAAMFIFSDVEKEPDFISGYESITGEKLTIGESERKRMDLYRLYMSIIMHVETYRYGKLYAALVKLYTNSQIKKLLRRLR